MEKGPTVGESVCVEHEGAASLAKIISVTRDGVRIRYEGWIPTDRGEAEFDLALEDLSPRNATVPWSAHRDRTVLPSPELMDAFMKSLSERRFL